MAHSDLSTDQQQTTVAPAGTLRVHPSPRPLLEGERIEAYYHPEFGWWGLIGRDELVGDTTRHVPSHEIWDKFTFLLFTGMSTATFKQEAPYVCGRKTVDPTKTRYAREGKLKAAGTRMPPNRFYVQKRTFLQDWAANIQLVGRDQPYDDPAKDRRAASPWEEELPDHDPFHKRRR